MKTATRLGIGLLAIAGFSLGCRAELVDNPMYAAWAKYPVGTWVRIEGDVVMAPINGEDVPKMHQYITYELAEVKPDEVVLNVTTVMDLGRRQSRLPMQRMSYPAKTEKGTDGVLSLDDANPNLTRTFKEMKLGKDKIEIYRGAQAQEINAITREYTYELQEKDVPGIITMTTKVWYDADVPGEIVRMSSTGVGALQTTTDFKIFQWTRGTGTVSQLPAPQPLAPAPATTAPAANGTPLPFGASPAAPPAGSTGFRPSFTPPSAPPANPAR